MNEIPSISPAYVAYKTFKNTIRDLAPAGELPARVDYSVLGPMSGSARSQFLNALRFLDLVDRSGVPSTELCSLATADEETWRATLKPILMNRYSPAILDALKSGTPKTLDEAFGDIGQSIIKPSMRFLVKAAEDVGVPVGPHVSKGKVGTNGSPSKRRARRTVPRPSRETYRNGTPAPSDFKTALLAKFPEFNPEWGEEQQKSWFLAYQKLLSMTAEGGENNAS